MSSKTTLVLGASDNPARYSFMAIQRLLSQQHEIVAVGSKETVASGIPITKEKILYTNIHTITLYLNPQNQKQYYEYILSLQPKRIIFNPGTENDELTQLAQASGIETLEACTLVLLASGQY